MICAKCHKPLDIKIEGDIVKVEPCRACMFKVWQFTSEHEYQSAKREVISEDCI